MTVVSDAARMAKFLATNPEARAQMNRMAAWGKKRIAKKAALMAKKRMFDSVGHEPGTGNAKRDTQITTTPFAATGNSLYAIEVTALIKDTGSPVAGENRENINTRQRGVAYISGVIVNQVWRNNTNEPYLVRWALVHPHDNTESGLLTDFFRGYNNERSLDFSNARSSIQKQTHPINVDENTVLYSGSMYLGPNAAAGAYTERSSVNMCSLNTYLPIKRQVRYDTDTVQNCNDKIFLVWWATQYLTAGTDDVPTAITTQSDIITVFRDPVEMLLSRGGIKGGVRAPNRSYKVRTFTPSATNYRKLKS